MEGYKIICVVIYYEVSHNLVWLSSDKLKAWKMSLQNIWLSDFIADDY